MQSADVLPPRPTPPRVVSWTAHPAIQRVIDQLGRTEDICFSPGGRRFAVAGFHRDRILVVDFDLARATGEGATIQLTRLVEIESPVFRRPHGVGFIDERRIVVASRQGGVDVLDVPDSNEPVLQVRLMPLVSAAMDSGLLHMPGSVRVGRTSPERIELLVCNNLGDTVTRHELSTTSPPRFLREDTLLRKWIKLPDGIAQSRDGRWFAVSNQLTRTVLIYDRNREPDAGSDPVGILRQVRFPHGVVFSADGRFLVVSDADGPYLHVFCADPTGWLGVRNPVACLRAMDDATYQRGHYAPGEGGIKGIGFLGDTAILGVTSLHVRLQFFDLEALIGESATRPVAQVGEDELRELLRLREAQMDYELLTMSQLTEVEAYAEELTRSLSWRLTEPLRKVKRWFKSAEGKGH